MQTGVLAPTVPGPARTPVLEATGLTVLAGARVLLEDVSLSLGAGELVALIGPSGAGKTTLLEALSGSGPLHSGVVRLAEPDPESRYGIGYVPSGDPLHDGLTVAEELFFAAALRGPASAGLDELEATVETILADLQLSGQADQRIASLSKGERRRVSLAIELVGQPDVLLLDEPGSGLDAALERRMMRLLRGLADRGRAILAATHATGSLALCHRVVVMGTGGTLAYVGPVDGLLGHFGVRSVDEIYDRLDDLAAADVGADAAAGAGDGRASRTGVPRMGVVERPVRLGAAPGLGRQLGILTERAAICRLRDARSLAVLIGQAPIIGLAIALVLPHGAITNSSLGPYYSVLLAFMLLTASVWLGTISACRDITAEIGTVAREAAVGVRVGVYMFAKCLTLFPVVLLQTGLVAVVVVAIQPLPEGVGWIIITCMVTGLASACFGLLLSAWSRNSDIAVGSTPLVIIPQLLLGGALIPITTMPVPFRVLSEVFVGRWSFDALGSALGLNQSLGTSLSSVTGLAPTSFAVSPGTPCLIMAGLGAVTLFLATLALAARIRT